VLRLLVVIISFTITKVHAVEWIEKGDKIGFQTSILTKHWNPKPEHNNHQNLINFEITKKSQWLAGIAFFRNSFNQDTQYLYGGYKWTLPKTEDLGYFKLTAGPMHGYKGEYKDKIPLNQAGIAPAILPSVGISYKQIRSELVIFGGAGAMLTFGFDLTID